LLPLPLLPPSPPPLLLNVDVVGSKLSEVAAPLLLKHDNILSDAILPWTVLELLVPN
jgi:hypothetical protein